MPGRRGVTLLEDLPDDIMDKILIRLPSKDVGRCRTVSASWRSATSTPAFVLEHRRRQPSFPIVDGQGRPASLVVVRDANVHEQLWPFLPGSEHRLQNSLRGACDGFLIVSRGNQLYICNPVIRTCALLPEPQRQYNTIAGFYCHHSTGEYRVLWVSQSHDSSTSSLYVLTVGSDKPRHIRVRMPTVSSPSAEQKLLNKLRFSSDCSPPVHHRGSLHWRHCGTSGIMGGGGDIIVFDAEAESFRWMRGPTQPCHCRKLFDMEGTLALWGGSTTRSTSMDVWVMHDYDAEIWAFKYRIDLSTVEASRQLYSTSFVKKRIRSLDSTVRLLNDITVLNKCELLIMFNKKHVLRCDVDGKFLGVVNIGKSHYCMLLTQHRLQESIVPIPGHDMMQEKSRSLHSPQGMSEWS
ncbi:hypothetical protein CFC21_012963 [Triticum aestivum]|uniref:F-box domain-containing protein n=2 Tax=Triticum aestivum TaxID=4565 RepID=A0A9R1IXH5_WHEAT|nr:hypothetical protein CFC21_012963 [Triticum aestivum]